jgi:hypothetical protein
MLVAAWNNVPNENGRPQAVNECLNINPTAANNVGFRIIHGVKEQVHMKWQEMWTTSPQFNMDLRRSRDESSGKCCELLVEAKKGGLGENEDEDLAKQNMWHDLSAGIWSS